jgi:hypothetical protein
VTSLSFRRHINSICSEKCGACNGIKKERKKERKKKEEKKRVLFVYFYLY